MHTHRCTHIDAHPLPPPTHTHTHIHIYTHAPNDSVSSASTVIILVLRGALGEEQYSGVSGNLKSVMI